MHFAIATENKLILCQACHFCKEKKNQKQRCILGLRAGNTLHSVSVLVSGEGLPMLYLHLAFDSKG